MVAESKALPAPVDWDELYPGRFLKASEFKGQKVTLRISAVRIEELVGDKGPQIKGVISFEKTEKQWALNKTNGLCLREMFGRKVQEWVGKWVTLFPSQFDGEDCIRVWGSPELAEDKAVTIALPRRRPFEMTLHKVARPGAKAATPAAPDGQGSGAGSTERDAAIQQMRAASNLDALAAARKSVWAVYASASREVPLDVETVYHDRRRELAGEMA